LSTNLISSHGWSLVQHEIRHVEGHRDDILGTSARVPGTGTGAFRGTGKPNKGAEKVGVETGALVEE